jgi:hypothetical protein
MPEDFLDKCSRLESSRLEDDIIPKVLAVGGEIVLAKTRSNLQSVIGKNLKYKSRSTGELVSALGVSPARLDKKGNYNVKIGFDEPRRGGVSNALIANTLEYGKHGQPPKPFLKPARSASRTPAIEAMKQKLEDEINKL